MRISNEKPRVRRSFKKPDGPGLEPGLTDPGSVYVRSRLLLIVHRAAYLGQLLVCGVAHCSAMFLMYCVLADEREHDLDNRL